MASQPGPLPQVSIPFVDADRKLSLSARQYMPSLDAAFRGVFGFFASATFATQSTPGRLVTVATPSNADAAAAGVAIGGLYCDNADPARVYIRTA